MDSMVPEAAWCQRVNGVRANGFTACLAQSGVMKFALRFHCARHFHLHTVSLHPPFEDAA